MSESIETRFKKKILNLNKKANIVEFGETDGYAWSKIPAQIELYKMNSHWLFGGVGRGKTWIMKELYNAFGGVIFITWNDIYNGNLPSAEVKINSTFYKKSKVLIIDDFGTTKLTSFGMDLLFEVINYRYENKLPTFITSNISIEVLFKQMKLVNDIQANRIYDRVKTWEQVKFAGESYRGRKTN